MFEIFAMLIRSKLLCKIVTSSLFQTKYSHKNWSFFHMMVVLPYDTVAPSTKKMYVIDLADRMLNHSHIEINIGRYVCDGL